jgi:hypothetical protein
LTTLLVCALLALVLAGALVVILGQRLSRDQPTLQIPTPPVVPVLDPPKKTPPRLTLHLVSASGRSLGSVSIDARARKPMFSYRTRDDKCLSIFTADHCGPHGWVYRRVGVERETTD